MQSVSVSRNSVRIGRDVPSFWPTRGLHPYPFHSISANPKPLPLIRGMPLSMIFASSPSSAASSSSCSFSGPGDISKRAGSRDRFDAAEGNGDAEAGKAVVGWRRTGTGWKERRTHCRGGRYLFQRKKGSRSQFPGPGLLIPSASHCGSSAPDQRAIRFAGISALGSTSPTVKREK